MSNFSKTQREALTRIGQAIATMQRGGSNCVADWYAVTHDLMSHPEDGDVYFERVAAQAESVAANYTA